MEHYSNVITELKENLEQITTSSEGLLAAAASAIKKCRNALGDLRSKVKKHGFPDEQSEIWFFKEIKPDVFSHLLYYQSLFEWECFRSTAGKKGIKQYLKNKIEEIQRYMDEHLAIVQYFRCGYTYMDRFYFVRNMEEVPVELREGYYLMDEEFNTWQDHNFSVIRANEMLLEFIHLELVRVEIQESPTDSQKAKRLSWTANKIDLVELIYALYFSKVINDGDVTIKELGAIIGQIFRVDVTKDVYRYFIEIQQRKIDQTKFIAHLQSVLQQHIEENIS